MHLYSRLGVMILAVSLTFGTPAITVALSPEEQRLEAEVAKIKTNPCGTALEFVKIGVFGSDWYLTCPGCASIPADRVFSKRFLHTVEMRSVNGRITATWLMKTEGACGGM